MKAFEVWDENEWDKNKCGSGFPCGIGISCGTCEILRKDGWRAALEWVERLYIDEVVSGASNGLYMFRKKIRQELESK